jgi:hypothetical protein
MWIEDGQNGRDALGFVVGRRLQLLFVGRGQRGADVIQGLDQSLHLGGERLQLDLRDFR